MIVYVVEETGPGDSELLSIWTDEQAALACVARLRADRPDAFYGARCSAFVTDVEEQPA